MLNKTNKLFFTLGVGLFTTIGAGQVLAQQAYVSGSSTLVMMSGASQSIGAELAAPLGVELNPNVVVTPEYQGTVANLSDNNVTFNDDATPSGLTVASGVAAAAPVGASFTAAAAAELAAVGSAGTDQLDEIVSIIRAGAGVDGLD